MIHTHTHLGKAVNMIETALGRLILFLPLFTIERKLHSTVNCIKVHDSNFICLLHSVTESGVPGKPWPQESSSLKLRQTLKKLRNGNYTISQAENPFERGIRQYISMSTKIHPPKSIPHRHSQANCTFLVLSWSPQSVRVCM